MSSRFWTLRSKNVVTPEGVRPACIHISDGRVAAVLDHEATTTGEESIDVGDAHVLPGIVDTHVHVNEPGRTEWEGFETATRAAAAGGVTTIVDMPLNSIPATTSVEALERKLESLEGKCHVDVGLWGGIVPGNAAELAPMLERGALGFKCFLVDSGVSEFPPIGLDELARVLSPLRDRNAPLLVHAEDPGILAGAEGALRSGAASHYDPFLRSRPNAAEDVAIANLATLARATRAHVHVVHLSSGTAAEIVRRAKSEGLAISAETTPHYLFFTSESVPSGATEYKCAPPIRENANRELLWSALANGTIDCVVTDHSPCTPQLKQKDTGSFADAWGGIASLQFGLSAVWTEAFARGMSLAEVSRLMSATPAKLARLWGRKGAIHAGFDADFVVFDPNASFTVEEAGILHRHKVTPYLGRTLRGRVLRTFLRGTEIPRDATRPNGVWVARANA